MARVEDKYSDLREEYDYSGGSNIVFFGVAPAIAKTSDALWKIYKLEYDGSDSPLRKIYANGIADFVHVWDTRATQVYSTS